MLYQILVFTKHGKNLKIHVRTINLEFQLEHGTKNLNYLMDHILYQVFKVNFNIYEKSTEKKPLIFQKKIHVNKIENTRLKHV